MEGLEKTSVEVCLLHHSPTKRYRIYPRSIFSQVSLQTTFTNVWNSGSRVALGYSIKATICSMSISVLQAHSSVLWYPVPWDAVTICPTPTMSGDPMNENSWRLAVRCVFLFHLYNQVQTLRFLIGTRCLCSRWSSSTRRSQTRPQWFWRTWYLSTNPPRAEIWQLYWGTYPWDRTYSGRTWVWRTLACSQ